MSAKEHYIDTRVNELLKNDSSLTFLQAYNFAKDEWELHTSSSFRNTYNEISNYDDDEDYEGV